MKAIRVRRDQSLAHTDPKPFADPAAYVKAGHVSYRQVAKLLERTDDILNKFSLLWRGAAVSLHLEGETEVRHTLLRVALPSSFPPG